MIDPINDLPDDERWTRESREAAAHMARLRAWREKIDKLNATAPPCPAPEYTRGEVLTGYGWAAVLVGAGILFGFLLAVLVRH